MGHKSNSLHFCLAVCILLSIMYSQSCFYANGNLRTNIEPSQTPIPALPEIVKTERGYLKPNGWDISPLSSMIVIQEFTGEDATLDGFSLTVNYRRYKPESELLTTEPGVLLSDSGSFIRINNVVALSFKGKTFAYSFVSAVVKKDLGSGKYTQDGPGIVYLYVDEDGDGLFELLKADSSQFFVPRWVYMTK